MKTKNIFLFLLLIALISFVSTMILTACEGGGTASCNESCDDDDDCQSGLTCFDTIRGKECLPGGCDVCFDDGRTCYTEENLAEQEEGEEKSCKFVRCQ